MKKIFISFCNQVNGYNSAALIQIHQTHSEAKEFFSLCRVMDASVDIDVNDFLNFEDILAEVELGFIALINRNEILTIMTKEQSTQKIIEYAQETLTDDELKKIREIDLFEKLSVEDEALKNRVLKLITEMSGYGLEDTQAQIEVAKIYDKLQDELVAQFHFTKELVKNFKNNPEKYANAKCLEDNNEVEEKENIEGEYLLFKLYEYANLLIVFSTCEEDEFQLIECENDFIWDDKKELLELSHESLVYRLQKLTTKGLSC